MGKLKGVVALALSGILATSTVQAQTPVTFDLGGGVSIPLGDYSDFAGTGWHGFAGVTFAPASLPVGFRVDGMYQRLGVENTDLDHQLINGTANVIFTFPTASETVFRPYLVGGVGLYNSKVVGDDDLEIDDDSATDFGVNAGAGFRFRAGAVGLFVEGRFHNVFTDGSDINLIPITVGITLGGN